MTSLFARATADVGSTAGAANFGPPSRIDIRSFEHPPLVCEKKLVCHSVGQSTMLLWGKLRSVCVSRWELFCRGSEIMTFEPQLRGGLQKRPLQLGRMSLIFIPSFEPFLYIEDIY